MIYQTVGDIYEAIDKTRAKLKEKIASLSDEQLAQREDENGWTVAEIIEHLATVENGGLRIAQKLLKESDRENVVWNGTFREPLSFVEKAALIQDRKLQAPERVRPTGTLSIAESLAKLDENRRALSDLRLQLEAVDVSGATFPHPFFGELNAYEWLVVVGLHERRHLAQIERILASAAESN